MSCIGIYLGLSGDETPNVKKLLQTWDVCIADQQVEVFGSANPPNLCPYLYVPTSDSPRVGPYSKLVSGTIACLQYVRKRDPDVLVQLVKYNTHATPVTIAGVLTNTPTITRLSGDVYNSHRGLTGYERIFSYVLNAGINGIVPPRLSSKQLAFGNYSKRQLLERGANTEDVFVLPPVGFEERFHPVDDKQRCRDELGITYEGTIAVYVGRISKLKGMPFLRDVMRNVFSDTNIRFMLVGDGPYRDELVREFGDAVIAPGNVPYADIDQYYKAADLYVHPSRFEGIPLVILEALSTGLPVVARRAGDIPSVTPNIVDSPDEMAQRIRDGEYSSEWLNKDRFSMEYQRTTLQELLDEILEDSFNRTRIVD